MIRPQSSDKIQATSTTRKQCVYFRLVNSKGTKNILYRSAAMSDLNLNLEN